MQPDPTRPKALQRARARAEAIKDEARDAAITFNAGTCDAGRTSYAYEAGYLSHQIQELCEEIELLKEEVREWREARDALQAFVEAV